MTRKQRLFVHEYLVDFNATQAAIRVGYSEKTAYSQAGRLLKNVEIVDKIQSIVNARAKRLDGTVDRVVQELIRVAFADLRRVAAIDEQGLSIVATEDWDEDSAALVSEITQTQHGLRIKTHSKMQALELLGKHLGMFLPPEAKGTEKSFEVTRKILGIE